MGSMQGCWLKNEPVAARFSLAWWHFSLRSTSPPITTPPLRPLLPTHVHFTQPTPTHPTTPQIQGKCAERSRILLQKKCGVFAATPTPGDQKLLETYQARNKRLVAAMVDLKWNELVLEGDESCGPCSCLPCCY